MQVVLDSPPAPLPAKPRKAFDFAEATLLPLSVICAWPLPWRAPARMPTSNRVPPSVPLMVLLSTFVTIVPFPSSTMLMAWAGLFVTFVERLLALMVPLSEPEPVTATLMPTAARTVAVLLSTSKTPMPVDADMLIADWPAPEPPKVQLMIVASERAEPLASTWMPSEVWPTAEEKAAPLTTIWKLAVPELKLEM